jgi:transcriptional regulator with XRE-family HTH domain
MSFPVRLKYLMASKETTQSQVSSSCNIAQSLISDYLNGKVEPSLKNSKKIADYFHVSLDWLAGVEKDAAFKVAERGMPYDAGSVQKLLKYFGKLKTEQKELLLNLARALAREK